MVGTPDLERNPSKQSSQMLESLGDMSEPTAGPSVMNNEKARHQDAQMSAFLREEAMDAPHAISHSPQGSVGSTNSNVNKSKSRERHVPSHMSSPAHLKSDSNSPAHLVARSDIRASAERILFTYLLPGAEREIILPHTITQDITVSIEEHSRDDPEVFDAAKDYVFQAMERDAFPGFLQQKALGNLVPPSKMLRLVLGLLSLFGAFWASFVLVFIDKDRRTRCWVRQMSVCRWSR
jgi:hypothetical protein